MMLVLGGCLLIEGTIDVACCNDDRDAAVGEDVLTLLLDVSSSPSPASP